MKKEVKKEAKKVIKAWESLEGDKRYTPKEIEKWLEKEMSPAINNLRKKLKSK